MDDMSQSPLGTVVPRWTVGDRLNKALHHAGISVGEMSEYLGLSRNSVSAYINDRQAPKRQTLLLWAMRTGVAMEWIETGVERSDPTPPDGMESTPELERLAAQKRRGREPRNTHRYLTSSAAAA